MKEPSLEHATVDEPERIGLSGFVAPHFGETELAEVRAWKAEEGGK